MLIPIGASRPLIRTPWVTMTIMGLNCLVHLVVSGSGIADQFHIRFGYFGDYPSLLTLFTHMFLHADIFHLVGNLFFFAVPALKMEDALGHFKFLLMYLACGITAAMIQNFVDFGGPPLPMIGASGAIAGVMGAFMIMYPFSQVKIWFFFIVVFFLPAFAFFGFWFGKELLYLILSDRVGGVAFGAHVGGFFAGALWMYAFFGWDQGEDADLAAIGEIAGRDQERKEPARATEPAIEDPPS